MAPLSHMTQIGGKLRLARESKGLALEKIASATKINLKFLQEIDGGIVPNVPVIYLHAFIKSYAREVGIDHEELLDALKEPEPAPVQEMSDAAEKPVVPAKPKISVPPRIKIEARPRTEGENQFRRQTRILLGFAAIVVVGLVVSVYWLRNERDEKAVQEISFADVVKEQASKLQPPDSAAKKAPVSNVPSPVAAEHRQTVTKDSLVLEAVTSESVWVHISIDDASANEYTFPPDYRMTWKASDRFIVALGNPGGVSFHLNGTSLGRLAEGRKPLKNITISHENLQPRQ